MQQVQIIMVLQVIEYIGLEANIPLSFCFKIKNRISSELLAIDLS